MNASRCFIIFLPNDPLPALLGEQRRQPRLRLHRSRPFAVEKLESRGGILKPLRQHHSSSFHPRFNSVCEALVRALLNNSRFCREFGLFYVFGICSLYSLLRCLSFLPYLHHLLICTIYSCNISARTFHCLPCL